MNNSQIFQPTTERIKKLSDLYPKRIKELLNVFDKNTNVYIDYANVIHWASKLEWHIDTKRLKQLFCSFSTVKSMKFYNGTLVGNTKSEDFNEEMKHLNYEVKTKPVKIMKLPIDVSSIPNNDPAILKNFIKEPLLKKLTIETVEYLNTALKELNSKGIKYIEVKKCNFDVEIARDMLLDYERNDIDNFILWSGDSDFADPVTQLIKDGKKVVVFATARRFSTELGETEALKFDIQKIRNFICLPKQITEEAKSRL